MMTPQKFPLPLHDNISLARGTPGAVQVPWLWVESKKGAGGPPAVVAIGRQVAARMKAV